MTSPRWRMPLGIFASVLFFLAAAALLLVRPGAAGRPGWQVIRPPHEVSALQVQGEVVWAGGSDGLFAIDRASGRLLPGQGPPFQLHYVRALLLDRQGCLWVGHEGGLTVQDGAHWRTLTTQDGLPDDRVTALYEDSRGRIWAGTWDGLGVWDGRSWQRWLMDDGLLANMVNVIFEAGDGSLWFGSSISPGGGLSIYTGQGWQYFTIDNGLPHNHINAILPAQDGRVWVGTGYMDRGGAVALRRSDSGSWQIDQALTTEDGLAGPKVRSIYGEASGVLWFGSEYDGLARYDGTHWKVFTTRDGLANNEVKAMRKDSGGNLWLATAGGITRVDAPAAAALGEP